MKHRIRINGQVQEFDCELGSHVYDCNGREIFEGDIVKVRQRGNFIVRFRHGDFDFGSGLGLLSSPLPDDMEIVTLKDTVSE